MVASPGHPELMLEKKMLKNVWSYPVDLLGERSEPHTGVFNRDFA